MGLISVVRNRFPGGYWWNEVKEMKKFYKIRVEEGKRERKYFYKAAINGFWFRGGIEILR